MISTEFSTKGDDAALSIVLSLKYTTKADRVKLTMYLSRIKFNSAVIWLSGLRRSRLNNNLKYDLQCI